MGNSRFFDLDRDIWFLMLFVLLLGVIIGLLMRGKNGGRTQPHTINDHKRANSNIVFGNIVIGSNNAPDSVMTFGTERESD